MSSLQVNEIKLVVTGPSILSWPLPLFVGGLTTLSGFALLMTLSVQTAALVACVGLGLAAWPALKAANTEYWITNSRVVVRSGLLSKRELSAAIPAISQMSVTQTKLQEFFGIGSLELRHAGGTLVIEGVEDPGELRQKILSLK